MTKYIVVTTEDPSGYSHWYYNPQVDVALGFLILLLVFVSIAAFFSYRNDESVIERIYYVDVERGEGNGKEKEEDPKKAQDQKVEESSK